MNELKKLRDRYYAVTAGDYPNAGTALEAVLAEAWKLGAQAERQAFWEWAHMYDDYFDSERFAKDFNARPLPEAT